MSCEFAGHESAPSKTTVLEASASGWSGWCPFPLRDITGCCQTAGEGTYHKLGGGVPKISMTWSLSRSVQTGCIVKEKALRSSLFWRLSAGLLFLGAPVL